MSVRVPSVPGWLWNGERLVVDDTVDGYIARRAVVEGRCRNLECTRRIAVDLHGLTAMGYGRAPIQEARSSFRCARRPSCDIVWTETYPDGLPLGGYVHDEGFAMAIACAGCGLTKRFSAAALIEKLVQSGLGDLNTGVNVVAGRIRGNCRCGRRAWRVELIRPDPMELRRKAAPGER